MSNAASAKFRLASPPSSEILSWSSSVCVCVVLGRAMRCIERDEMQRASSFSLLRPHDHRHTATLQPACLSKSQSRTLQVVLQGGGDVDVPVAGQIATNDD